MRKLILSSIILIVIMFAVNIYFYSIMPDTMITHWNQYGEPNGTMSKLWGLFLLPIITLVIFLIFLFLPKIDPLKKNIKKFQTSYEAFIIIITIFMFYINILTVLWNKGIEFNMNNSIIIPISFIFIFLGFIMKNIKQNWFIGIRTPWTLSNEKVWNKTHKLAGKLFIISGLLTLLGIFFPKLSILFILVPIIISSIWLAVYSYLEFRKIKKR